MFMNPIRVSVVLPAYNEEKILARCLASLESQTITPYEIIVVDNNSTDATAQIAKDHGVIVISEARQGIAWARDAGFHTASGDIIARMDADCIAPPEWIERITGYYQSTPQQEWRAITGTGYYAIRSVRFGKILGAGMTAGYNIGNRLMLGSIGLYGSCMAFPRSWWEDVKEEVCHDSHVIHEDIDISVHLMKKGYIIKKLRGFYTFIDSRTLSEPPSKTWWRWKTWPPSAFRHRKEPKVSRRS